MSKSDKPKPIRHMDHVALITNDLDATIDFYCGLLGGEVVGRGTSVHDGARLCFISLGSGARLEFFEFPNAEMPDWTSMFLEEEVPKTGRILEHVAFRVDSEEELVALQERVSTAGIKVIRPPGRNVIFFPDPSNAVVQIVVGDLI